MNGVGIIKEVIFGAFLLGNTYSDIRFRRISGSSAVLAAIFGMIIRMVSGGVSGWELFFALLPGFIGFLLAKVTGEAIGYGDAWGVTVAGIFLGAEMNFEACMNAIVLAGIWALLLLAFFHKNRKYEIPFFPFLLGGILVVRCIR